MSAASTVTRPTPHVPHHAVVRAIGRGSYGEIWLARSLTGAWRAVKIVERARFEDTRAFEREFEGMAKFEPVSREHGGFVDILHVGRSDDDAFFYYVMELADDLVPRGTFEPAIYQPKTLKSELQRVARLPAEEAINLGLSLTLALSALHRHGLVHRDIKPANIIFVAGQPKIADIGLVSPLGQASFVGTEGYVPPEGPGTAQADIYSLGKVLYELSMGKDRLEFPEVNSDIDVLPDRDALLRLNQVLWRACAHDPALRYASADEMHEDLLRVREGKPLLMDSVARRRWLPIVALVAAVGTAAAWWVGPRGPQLPVGTGTVILETEPPGRMIRIDSFDKRVITTAEKPSVLADVPAGHHTGQVFGAKNYESVDFSFDVSAGQETRVPKIVLQRSMAMVHLDSEPAGCAFELHDGDVVKEGKTPQSFEYPTGEYEVVFRQGRQSKTARLTVEREGENKASVAFVTRTVRVTSFPPGAEIVCEGIAPQKAPCDLPLLEGRHKLIARLAPWKDDFREIEVGASGAEPVAFSFATGSVKIGSKPAGADVFLADERVGETTGGSFFEENLPPGERVYTLTLEGYKSQQVKVTVEPGKTAFKGVEFEARPGPRRGEPWTNSLNMNFVPVGNLLVGVWLVRVRDFALYSVETGRTRLTVTFPQDENHPVVRVNWEDAKNFCDWLTRHEREAGKLDEGQVYRLPTDAEWSMFAGMPEESGDTPEKRDGINRDYIWGRGWPPPGEAPGNYADLAARPTATGRQRVGTIGGYNDGFAFTSPVGSFRPSPFGLYDVSGNVWQWVEDSYNGGLQKKDWGVLRGGSWATSKQEELRLGYRNVVSREERDVIFGFRCVLVPGS